MKGKKFITIILVMIMLLSCFLPTVQVFATEESAEENTTEENTTEESTGENTTEEGTTDNGVKEITLNSKLYSAIKDELLKSNVEASYNDLQYTISLTQDALSSVKRLNLSNKEIKDLDGLENFSSLESLDLSSNLLTDDTDLSVINGMPLTFLDLSSNKLTDVSAITDIDSINTLNLHDQRVSKAYIINNKIAKDGQYTYDIELPQIVRQYAKNYDVDIFKEEVVSRSDSNLKFDFSSFTPKSDFITINIAASGDSDIVYEGLIVLKIVIKDKSNKLANTEILMNCVVINEDQEAIEFNDENLYKAIRDQLTEDQDKNDDLKKYTNLNNLYDHAYDEQKILVINKNDLVNKIKSLKLSNCKISDLKGIEKFIGLEDELDLSSNYIDSIDRVLELQENKQNAESELQARFKEKLEYLEEEVKKYEELQKQVDEAVKNYNSTIDAYNNLKEEEKTSEKGTELNNKREEYIKELVTLTGKNIPNDYNVKISDNGAINLRIAQGGKLGIQESYILDRLMILHNVYNDIYKTLATVTPELRHMSQEELNRLNLEQAKSLYNSQIEKIKKIEESFDDRLEERAELKLFGTKKTTEKPNALSEYLTELGKSFEENKNVSSYINMLNKFRRLDAVSINKWICSFNINEETRKFTHRSHTSSYLYKEKDLDGEDVEYLNYMVYEFSQSDPTLNDECPHIDTDHGELLFEPTIISAKRISVLDDAEISAYVTLPKLYKLDMRENLLENVNGIEDLKDLRYLDLADNTIVSIDDIDWIAIEKLNTLNLSFNNISDVKCLENLPYMRILNLSKNLISGALDFDITSLKKLEKIDFSENQIDNIEVIKEQYKFIAKDKDMTLEEFISAGEPEIDLRDQELYMIVTTTAENQMVDVELPLIFRQLEELDSVRTSFYVNSFHGNVTSDGKSAKVFIPATGVKTATVSVSGSGIGSGTTCTISFEKTEEKPAEDPINPDQDEGNKLSVKIDTSEESCISEVKAVNNKNYIVVPQHTTVKDVLERVSLETEDENISIVVKNLDNTATKEETENLKTNENIVLEGTDKVINCVIVVKGDVNSDGEVNLGDIVRMNERRLGNIDNISEAELIAGDINGNNDFDMADLIAINNYRLEITNEL